MAWPSSRARRAPVAAGLPLARGGPGGRLLFRGAAAPRPAWQTLEHVVAQRRKRAGGIAHRPAELLGAVRARVPRGGARWRRRPFVCGALALRPPTARALLAARPAASSSFPLTSGVLCPFARPSRARHYGEDAGQPWRGPAGRRRPRASALHQTPPDRELTLQTLAGGDAELDAERSRAVNIYPAYLDPGPGCPQRQAFSRRPLSVSLKGRQTTRGSQGPFDLAFPTARKSPRMGSPPLGAAPRGPRGRTSVACPLER